MFKFPKSSLGVHYLEPFKELPSDEAAKLLEDPNLLSTESRIYLRMTQVPVGETYDLEFAVSRSYPTIPPRPGRYLKLEDGTMQLLDEGDQT